MPWKCCKHYFELFFMKKKQTEKAIINLNADLRWHDIIPGARLRALRKDRGLSLVQLETLSGVSDSEIHRVETGQQDCGIQSLVRLCAALGTTPGYILDRALGSNRAEMQRRIEADDEFVALKARLKFASPERIASLTDALIQVCQAVSILLRCSAPVAYLQNLQFPLEEWKTGFADFAARIASIEEGVDRASMMYGILAHPLQELRSQGLLPAILLTPVGLAKLPHGGPDGWVIPAKPDADKKQN